jgi:hypothetical protein
MIKNQRPFGLCNKSPYFENHKTSVTDQDPEPAGQAVLLVHDGAPPPEPVPPASQPEGQQHPGAPEQGFLPTKQEFNSP